MEVTIDQALQRGVASHKEGKLEDAERLYRAILKVDPQHPDANHNLGVLIVSRNDVDASLPLFKTALEADPKVEQFWFSYIDALIKLDKLDDARTLFNQATEKGIKVDAFENLKQKLERAQPGKANTPKIQNPPKEELQPLIDLYTNGYHNKALEAAEELLQVFPHSEMLYNLKGAIYNNLGYAASSGSSYFDRAIRSYKKAIKIKPNFAEAHNNLGAALYGKGDIDSAIDHYNQALEIKPDFGKAHSNIATVYNDRGYLVEAIESYQNAIDFSPSLTEAHSQLIHLIGSTGNWGAIEKKIDLIKSLGLSGDSVIPFCMLPLDDAPSRQNKRAELYAQQRFTNNPLPPILRPNKPPSRLRIGYFSADFYDHTVTHLICRMLELHDTEKFEIYAYSFSSKKEDAMRVKVIDAVDSFRDIHDMSDMDAAMLAREDKIDIAVDLTGYTKNCRSGIFAYHAAPIQINYLGYPGTMGADFMDYIIIDQILVPEDSRQYLSEKVIQMPYSYMVTNNTRELSAREITRSEMGLPEDGFVFCVFNNSYKISPREFDIWTRLLLKVEGSVLWMRHSNKWADENLRKEAQKRDIDPARLVFAERVPLDEHLARHQLADLFLDTFTFNAHSTAVDALWAGLPVLTKLGYSFAARVAGSLLNAVGMEDLITNTEQEYEDLALELASDPDKLNQLRQKLDTNRLTTPLFDTEQFTKYLENGYQQAYQIYSKGDNTDNIVIKH